MFRKQIFYFFPENLAFRKPTWEMYPSRPGWGSDKAVDGRYTNLSAGGGQCTVSGDRASTAEWRVDLGGVVSISDIFIQYMTDNIPWSKYINFKKIIV